MNTRILELGAGTDPTPNCIHHDRTKHHNYIDIAWDLDVIPWKLGTLKFDKIIALDVMEHLHQEVREWLNECWDWLNDDGLLVLRVPAWNHENAWTDPTHYMKFAPRTFDYWDKDKELHRKYGCIYFSEAKWWHIESAEWRDNDSNLAFVLRKVNND